MYRILVLFFTGLLALSVGLDVALAKTIYRYVDENGTVVYTDKEIKNAEEIEIEEPEPVEREQKSQQVNSLSGNQTSTLGQPAIGTLGQEPVFEYTDFRIIQPSNDDTIRENSGTVQVSVRVSPTLYPGHKVTLSMNGRRVGDGKSSGQFSLSNVDRGQHQLVAQIIDQEDKVIKSTPAVTFQLFRVSRNQRANRALPRLNRPIN